MAPRIAIGQILHETNSFSDLPTALEDFRRRDLLSGDAIVETYAGTDTSLGGFLRVAREAGWHLIPTLAARSTPAGVVTGDCYAALKAALIQHLAGALDGVLLALHGAMVTEAQLDAESDILELVRAIVGTIALKCGFVGV